MIKKASHTLGLIRRTLSRKVKAQAYSSLVRPQLDYASEVWNPCTTSEINRLEQIQRSAARFVYADYSRHTRFSVSQGTELGSSPYTQANPTGYNVLQDPLRPCPYKTPPNCLQRAHYISSRKDH